MAEQCKNFYVGSNRHGKSLAILFEICHKANPDLTQEQWERIVEIVFNTVPDEE